MGQEAAPADAPKLGLHGYPAQPAVQRWIAGGKDRRAHALPVLPGFSERVFKGRGRKEAPAVAVDAQRDEPASALPRPERTGREPQGGGHFIALAPLPGAQPGAVVDERLRPVPADRAHVILHRAQAADGAFAVFVQPADGIRVFARLVPALVEGHGGPERHAAVRHGQPVQQAGDVPVVADVVGAAAVQREGRRRDEGQGRRAFVRHGDAQQLGLLAFGGDERQDIGANAQAGVLPPRFIPQQSAARGTGFFIIITFCLLGGADARGAPQFAVRQPQPEIAPRAALVQRFDARRRQKEAVLPGLAVARPAGRDAADHARGVHQGKYHSGRAVGVAQDKIARRAAVFDLRHISSFLPFFV